MVSGQRRQYQYSQVSDTGECHLAVKRSINTVAREYDVEENRQIEYSIVALCVMFQAHMWLVVFQHLLVIKHEKSGNKVLLIGTT